MNREGMVKNEKIGGKLIVGLVLFFAIISAIIYCSSFDLKLFRSQVNEVFVVITYMITGTVKEKVEEMKTEPLELKGVGQQATRLFKLEKGLRRFTITHQGSRHFHVGLLDDMGNKIELLVNVTGSFSGSKAVKINKTGNYLMDIGADGEWTVLIE
jgi:predicted aspartyl protease